MKQEQESSSNDATKSISYFMNTKNWWQPLLFILVVSVAKAAE